MWSSRRTALLAGVLLVAAFACGIVVGFAGDRMILIRQHRVMPRHGGHFVNDRILHVLTRELKLDDAQKQKVRVILEQRQQNIERAMKQMQPAVEKEIDNAERQIDSVLRPEQRPRFHELRDHWRMRHRPGEPMAPPPPR